MARPDRSVCLSTAAILVLLSADPAGAGAWTRPAGEGLLIATTARHVAPISSLTGGPIDSDKNVSQLYLEYGLAEGLTAGAKFYVELSTSNFESSSASLGGFLRKRVWQDGKGGVGSLQAGYAHPVEKYLGQGLEFADPGAVPEAHGAALYGRGWAGDWGNAFVSTGIAYHWRGEQLADEIRGELTGGFAPRRDLMGILSLYGLYPLGEGGNPLMETESSLKIAPSIAYSIWPDEDETEEADTAARPRTIQLGISYDLLNPEDGIGFALSLWQPF